MTSSIIEEVSKNTGQSEKILSRVVEEFLAQLHKIQFELDPHLGLVSEIYWQLTPRAFYHLLGFIEQLSKHSSWEPGDINEYLGRLPPCDRWHELGKEMKDWKAKS